MHNMHMHMIFRQPLSQIFTSLPIPCRAVPELRARLPNPGLAEQLLDLRRVRHQRGHGDQNDRPVPLPVHRAGQRAVAVLEQVAPRARVRGVQDPGLKRVERRENVRRKYREIF